MRNDNLDELDTDDEELDEEFGTTPGAVETCPDCGSRGLSMNHWRECQGKCEPETHEFVRDESLPADYEECGDCGYDHQYDAEEAGRWHRENPGSYTGLDDVQEGDESDDLDETELDDREPSDKRETPAERRARRMGRSEEFVQRLDDETGMYPGANSYVEDENDLEGEPCEDCGTAINNDGFCTECGKNARAHDELPSTNTFDKRGSYTNESKMQESFSFDKYVDAIVLKESRCVTAQPDSPMRLRQQRRQEHPTGRVRYTR